MPLSFTSLTEETEFNKYWLNERVKARSRDVISWSALSTPYEYANISTYSLQDGSYDSSYRTAGHGDVELSFIRAVFREIDNLIEPEFVEVPSDQADILLISSLDDLYGGAAAGYFNVASSVSTGAGSEGDKIGYVTWRDATGIGYLDGWEMHVIVHEIGHSLRLSHPGAGGGGGGSGGYSPEWNTKDSVMSYNDYQGYNSLFFRGLDIEALQSLWGKETSPGSAGWPSTESVPSKVSYLDRPLPGSFVNQSDSSGNGLTVSEIDESVVQAEKMQLADEITNYPWQQEVFSQIGGDNKMSVYIDQKGRAPMSKGMRRAATFGPISALESGFIMDVASRIDSASALDISLVSSPKSADVIISGAKKMPRYSAYYDWGESRYHLAWFNRDKSLTSLDQVKITASLMAAAGLRESVDQSFSTFDTVMSWNGKDYYGLTEVDKIALSGLWGQP